MISNNLNFVSFSRPFTSVSLLKGRASDVNYASFSSASTWTASGQQVASDDGQASLVIDGEGTLIYLHPNGEKRLVETCVEGKLTDAKWWDVEGNPVESVDPSFLPPIKKSQNICDQVRFSGGHSAGSIR